MDFWQGNSRAQNSKSDRSPRKVIQSTKHFKMRKRPDAILKRHFKVGSLSFLALLRVEKETVDKIDFDIITDQFAATKARKNRFVIFADMLQCRSASSYCPAPLELVISPMFWQ